MPPRRGIPRSGRAAPLAPCPEPRPPHAGGGVGRGRAGSGLDPLPPGLPPGRASSSPGGGASPSPVPASRRLCPARRPRGDPEGSEKRRRGRLSTEIRGTARKCRRAAMRGRALLVKGLPARAALGRSAALGGHGVFPNLRRACLYCPAINVFRDQARTMLFSALQE